MPTEVDEIVRGLTKAQRQFLLMPMYTAYSHGISAAWVHGTSYWPARVVAKLGLVKRVSLYAGTIASVPTELGQQVAAALREQAK